MDAQDPQAQAAGGPQDAAAAGGSQAADPAGGGQAAAGAGPATAEDAAASPEQTSASSPRRKRRCYVISPIGKEGSKTREDADDVFSFIIEPAMKECDIDVVRADHLKEPGKISDQMFKEIFTDDLCVAVATEHNPNVFYELALAQASGTPLIILVKKNEALPFDIQDMRCVQYDLKPRPLFDGVYARAVIEHIRSLERSGWQRSKPFAAYGFEPRSDEGIRYLEHAAKYVPPEEWAAMAGQAREVFDLMGISLHSWDRSDHMRELLARRADAGCTIRVLVMDADNPALKLLFDHGRGLGDRALDSVRRDIAAAQEFFAGIAAGHPGLQLRTMRRGLPHCQLTRTDDTLLYIPYLNSQPTAYSPVWRCTAGTSLYRLLTRELEVLWLANAPQGATPSV
jgi:hypothetical protein